MTASDAHKQAWGIGFAGTPAPAAKPAARTRTKPAAKVPTDKPDPYLCARCSAGSHCHGDETCECKCGKTTRITVDLDRAAYTALNRWLGSAAAEVGAPVSKARALRAMIQAVDLDKSIGLVVIDLLRRNQP